MARQNQKSDSQRRRYLWVGLLIVFLLCAIAAAWKWTPLGDLLEPRRLSGWIVFLHQSPARYFYILGAYVVGSILLIPVTALILMTAVVYGPLLGSAYSLAGCLTGAVITYGIGLLLGQNLVQKIVGRKWQALEEKIEQSGIIAVAVLRLLPIAPFTVVNVVSGAFRVPVRDYIIGSLIGLAPGILVTNLFAHQLQSAIRDPGAEAFLGLAALIVMTIGGVIWFKRKFANR